MFPIGRGAGVVALVVGSNVVVVGCGVVVVVKGDTVKRGSNPKS